jgi:addiction module RelE/StbE family toxin
MKKPIILDKTFVKHYKKRILPDRQLHDKYKNAVRLFIKDSRNLALRNHILKGNMRSYRAFYVDSDCRVIYKENRAEIFFIDIGKHDQVYKK